MVRRFDDRRILTAAILELLERGVEINDLDVWLSRVGPVDLDLLADCLARLTRGLAQPVFTPQAEAA